MILHCKVDLPKNGKNERTIITINEDEVLGVSRFVVMTIRKGRVSHKGEPTIAAALAQVAGILALLDD